MNENQESNQSFTPNEVGLEKRVSVLEKEIVELKRQLETRQFLKGVTFNDLIP